MKTLRRNQGRMRMNNKGVGLVEIVMIIAILVSLALVFYMAW